MKEITVLSGKGGTGKTSLTAALASVASNAILCDNDVDAADLHLIMQPKILKKHIFQGAWVSSVISEKCTQCGICMDNCRFNAISLWGQAYHVNSFLCEGCRLCERICPENAIFSERSHNNFWYISATRFGTMVHAHMGPGEENSGKLVSLIRDEAHLIADSEQADFIINDGPPGIGCSTIASLSGTNAVLIVIEPSLSGWHDASRLIELARKFDIPLYAVINKFDLNTEITSQIGTNLATEKVPLLAKLPFSETMVEALIHEKTIIEFAPDSEISRLIEHIWEQIKN